MLTDLAVIIVGFAVLTWSADRFVTGASATARHLGIPTLIIGLTVVGIGTSAPEMLVSGIAAWQGNGGLALGNAVGSNITNIGLILGVCAVAYPLHVHSRILRRELPILLIIMAVALVVLLDLEVSRIDGLMLLAGMAVLLVWMGMQGGSDEPADAMGLEFEAEIPSDMPLPRALFWLVLSLALLLVSSRALVWASVNIAEAFGVSDLVIGLTIVALGTSLPELAASFASARKGEHDIALGNVIGSNMFNLLGVIGVAGALSPFDSESASLTRDFPIMVAMTIALMVMAWGRGGHGRINRVEGMLLLMAWVGYQVFLYVTEIR